jgi:hypothetical protein
MSPARPGARIKARTPEEFERWRLIERRYSERANRREEQEDAGGRRADSPSERERLWNTNSSVPDLHRG